LLKRYMADQNEYTMPRAPNCTTCAAPVCSFVSLTRGCSPARQAVGLHGELRLLHWPHRRPRHHVRGPARTFLARKTVSQENHYQLCAGV
jgi:hypothetical protein